MFLIFGIIKEAWNLFLQMSFYLALGFVVSGIISAFFKPETILKHLGRKGIVSVLKAVMLGVPLPLCSCGVLPPAATFYKSGASKGSVVAFLSSTPVTGIDSIFATYGLLGGLFMFCRIIASVLIGIVAGILVDIFSKEKKSTERQGEQDNFSCSELTIIGRLKYAFTEIYGSIAKWIFWGVLIGGIISYLVPDQFLSVHLGNRYLTYFLMLIIGVPLYVCATGSIPIAASLIAKGISPGAALIFLITGPATNTVTMLFVAKTLGKKSFIIYTITIVIIAFLSAMGLDAIISNYGIRFFEIQHRHNNFLLVSYISALILIGFAVSFMIDAARKKILLKKKYRYRFVFNVPEISCANCAKKIHNKISSVEGIKIVNVDVKKKRVEICSELSNKEEITRILASIGYPVSEY
ncbi:MAG: permease [Candidatus Omnitrophica bacterium]|nr:permease [Candidatus Omnitrophota bacterium]